MKLTLDDFTNEITSFQFFFYNICIKCNVYVLDVLLKTWSIKLIRAHNYSMHFILCKKRAFIFYGTFFFFSSVIYDIWKN